MRNWMLATFLLCMYGFLKEVRPSESFLTQYLESPWKNLTMNEINNEIYPVWTYSYVCLLFVVLIITDVLRYKPIIVSESSAYIVTWALLLWAQGVLAMQFMQFFYGIGTACNVAYFTYIYAKVPAEYYKKATSYTRAAVLFGQFLSGTLAQVLISTDTLDYHSLNYVSFANVIVATGIALSLPTVKTSVYFHREVTRSVDGSLSAETPPTETGESSVVDDAEKSAICSTIDAEEGDDKRRVEIGDAAVKKEYVRVPWRQAAMVILRDFKSAYSDSYQIKWCIWWSLATCGYGQVVNYVQSLWEEIYPSSEHEDLYNGAVDAVNTLVGALLTASLSFVTVDWDKWGELTLALTSLFEAGVLLVMATTKSIWVAYVLYGLYYASYHVLIAIASFQVAKQLKQESYGLVFGCNTFMALILQTIMTVIVVDERVLDCDPRTQFLVYGTYVGLIGLLFIIITYYSIRQSRSESRFMPFQSTSNASSLSTAMDASVSAAEIERTENEESPDREATPAISDVTR